MGQIINRDRRRGFTVTTDFDDVTLTVTQVVIVAGLRQVTVRFYALDGSEAHSIIQRPSSQGTYPVAVRNIVVIEKQVARTRGQSDKALARPTFAVLC